MSNPDSESTQASSLRRRILEALARGDGQMMDCFDLGHTAEMMYGAQADAVTLLIGKEVKRFAQEIARDLRTDASLTGGQPGARYDRRALNYAATDILRAAKAFDRRTQAVYNESPLSKPLRVPAFLDPMDADTNGLGEVE